MGGMDDDLAKCSMCYSSAGAKATAQLDQCAFHPVLHCRMQQQRSSTGKHWLPATAVSAQCTSCSSCQLFCLGTQKHSQCTFEYLNPQQALLCRLFFSVFYSERVMSVGNTARPDTHQASITSSCCTCIRVPCFLQGMQIQVAAATFPLGVKIHV